MRKILLVAGGGGHTGHAYTVAQFLKGRAELSFLIPRGDYYSMQKLRGLGEIYWVTKPFEPTTGYIEDIHRMARAFIESIRIRFNDYDAIACFGSNHCIAPITTAWLRGAKTILVESPVRIHTPSKTIRLLKYIADYIVVSWPEQRRFYPPHKTIVSGPLYEKPKYPPSNKGYILVTTGTYGFPELVEHIVKLPLDNVVVQTGRTVDPSRYRGIRPGWVFFDYDPDLSKWIAGADIVISHLGRTIIDAVYAYCKPVVIVPNPRWIRGAPVYEAVALARKTRSILVPRPEQLTIDIIEEARRRKRIIERICRETPNGARVVAELLLRV